MRLLLCSDFYNAGIKCLSRFMNEVDGKTCLFIGYAHENDAEMNESGVLGLFRDLKIKVVFLSENYKFNDKIDMIYCRGGNASKCLFYLKKYCQFEKILSLVKSGVLYMGQSTGALICGKDIKWTLEMEPYFVDLEERFGAGGYDGFGLIDKVIFVHAGKYRMTFSDEMADGQGPRRVWNREYYGDYLRARKKYDRGEFIALANNQVLVQDGGETTRKIITFDWSKIPIVDLK